MYMQNRLVSPELMYTLLGSGLFMALVILGVLFWLSREEKKDKPKIDKKTGAGPPKTHGCQKRK